MLKFDRFQFFSKLLTSRCFSSQLDTTALRYGGLVERGNFSILEKLDVEYFQNLLGDGQVVTDSHELEAVNIDFIRAFKGGSKLLLKPKTTKEVSSILKYCNDRRLAVCPQGGNTGLVGGGVPVFDEIVVSTSLMNKIISLDTDSDILIVEAGCVLGTLNKYLEDYGFIMPLDLGAKDSCQIGGNVSTNAGGLRFIRYRSLHSNVQGIEAVLPNGEILDCMNTMRKDNTGYDLKHLFIGSEGTLGFVTKIAISCPRKPKSVNLAFVGLSSFEKVLTTLSSAKQNLNEILSSCEYMDLQSMEIVKKKLKLQNPIAEFPYFMVIECSGSNSEHDQDKLLMFLNSLMKNGTVGDGTVVSDSRRVREIWSLRERVGEALLHDGYLFTYDLSLPVSKFDELVQLVRTKLGKKSITCCGFGHLGDGNLHLNFTYPQFDAEVGSTIEPYIYSWVKDKKGSISAEHGLGFSKRKYISYAKSNESIEIMRKLKTVFDPNGILNPYKVLPSQ